MSGQANAPRNPAQAALTRGTASIVTAGAPATRRIEIDGVDADEAWRAAREISGFRVYDPVEDGEPAFRTSARITYDARNVYLFVRAYDARPDSIVSLLSRRDVRTASDQIKVMIDSYHDRRTGYEFAVNPAGVKRDYYTYNDSREDISWDAIWDVATRIDSLGWSAEFRIPLSQLRYRSSEENTFGFMIVREVARTNERSSWPVLRRSRSGIASQFAEVTGFRGLSTPRRIELTPYVLARNVAQQARVGERSQQQTAGGDARIGIGPNLTLAAAVNPDFGQIEADPAVLNLTAFEVSFDERRPFFVEGSAAFGGNSTLFYSRRIGRAPQLSGLVSDPAAEIPTATTILGAAKLTGRDARGFTIGALGALTARESAGGAVIEPGTMYGLARVSRDFRSGKSGVGITGTLVQRDLREASSDLLRRSAQVVGVDARHRFADGRYNASAALVASQVVGSAAAIARTQRSSTHLFQRPDDALTYDPTRTSLQGVEADFSLSKVAGWLQFGGAYSYISPGFETNDLGFLQRADMQSASASATVLSLRPRAFWRNASAALIASALYTASGLPISNTLELSTGVELRNGARVSITSWSDNLAPAYCDRCARGGPALRVSPTANLLVNLTGDGRKAFIPYLAAIYTVTDGGRSRLWRVRPMITVRNGTNLSWELGTRYQKNIDNTQWVTNLGVTGADSTHYIFGRLNQDLLSFTARVNLTLTPTLSVQGYAEPFVSTGKYSDLRELSRPRSADYDARFRPTTLQPGNADFNFKQFNSNAVVRWEYRPGSVLYAVWQQGRFQADRDAGSFDASRDYGNLFGTRADNTFVLKASFWLNP